MARAISHFMWGYQAPFQRHQEMAARELFKTLDERFEPVVFLVGILADAAASGYPACIEPEEDFWIRAEDFDGALKRSHEKFQAHPERRISHAHPVTQQRHIDNLRKRALRDAVADIIDAHLTTPQAITYFTSLPVRVGHYWVCTIVGLQESLICEHCALKTTSIPVHKYRNVELLPSLLQATVVEFLQRAAQELSTPEPGAESPPLATDSILRAAGEQFMASVGFRVDQHCLTGAQSLFRKCTNLSSLFYERAHARGTVLLAEERHPALATQLAFSPATEFTGRRASRKLLELSSRSMPLHTDSERVFGLADLENYNPEEENAFHVHFIGHHHWELTHGGESLMHVHYGLPSLPRTTFDEKKLRTDLPRIFRDISPDAVERLVELIRRAENEPHGTTLVITTLAEEEVKRLRTQLTAIRPSVLTPDLLGHLTSIDGAVILSPDGVCHAVGAILDGKATHKGDPGRGARFNSAVRYVHSVEPPDTPCLAVVVSEDGGVDFVPDLKPAIRRSEIDAALVQMERLADSDAVSRRRFNALFEWFDERRFYLTAQDCASLNAAVPRIEQRLITEEGLRLVRREFLPNPEFDASLYYAPEDTG